MPTAWGHPDDCRCETCQDFRSGQMAIELLGRLQRLKARSGSVVCPKCGLEGRPGYSFCPNDGTKLAEPKSCGSCGHIVGPEANFCPGCGRKVSE